MFQHAFFVLADAAPSTPPPGPSGPSFLIPFLCIGVIFYFLMIRPQQKKQKELLTLVASLKTGDKVVTTGGIHGMISNVKEGTVLLKVADNVKIEVDKAHVATVIRKPEAEAVTAQS